MATVGDVGIGVAAEETDFALLNVRVSSWLALPCVSSEEALAQFSGNSDSESWSA